MDNLKKRCIMFDILEWAQQDPANQKGIKEPETKKDGKKIEAPKLPVGPKNHRDPCTPSTEDEPKKPQEPRPNDGIISSTSEKVPAVKNDDIRKKSTE